MRFFRYVLRPYLQFRLHLHQLTQTGAFSPNGAEYIDPATPVSGHALKKGLFTHHIKQFHESSCSVASVVTVINALGTLQQPGFLTITQKDILEKVRAGHWKERMGPNGHNGRRGLPLPLLKEVVHAALDVYNINYRSVTAVQAVKNFGQAAFIKAPPRRTGWRVAPIPRHGLRPRKNARSRVPASLAPVDSPRET